MKIELGRWTQEGLDKLIHESSKITDIGMIIDHISERFLDATYSEHTLIGDINDDEEFVINIGAVDCMTFLEYVEAMRLSSSFVEFKDNLKRVRYRKATVSFKDRNHFFTDWIDNNSGFVRDVTQEVGGDSVVNVEKRLNEKKDGRLFLNGIQPKKREIQYLPSNEFDASVQDNLRSGDYAGVYSEMPGLDVSHVGIVIKCGDNVILRHASSSEVIRKVVDEDLRGYMKDKPGMIVLRPKEKHEF
jgi:hypothetical protein